jgi:hypothetical protein
LRDSIFVAVNYRLQLTRASAAGALSTTLVLGSPRPQFHLRYTPLAFKPINLIATGVASSGLIIQIPVFLFSALQN